MNWLFMIMIICCLCSAAIVGALIAGWYVNRTWQEIIRKNLEQVLRKAYDDHFRKYQGKEEWRKK